MTAPVSITCTDCTSSQLHDLVSKSKSSKKARWLMAVSVVRDGISGSRAAGMFGVTARSVRNWIVRYNAGGPDGLADKPRSGRPPILGIEEQALINSWIEAGTDPQADGVCRWMPLARS